MADRAEGYLESLLIDAFKGKGFQKIDELFKEAKELDKNEFKNVSLLLKCIQLYLKSDIGEGKSLLIEQGLVICRCGREARQTVVASTIFIWTPPISSCTFQIIFLGKRELVTLFLPELGCLVTEPNLSCALHLEALKTLNTILEIIPREHRRLLPLCEEICLLAKDLAEAILEVGEGRYLSCAYDYPADYDLQVGLLEAVCRFLSKNLYIFYYDLQVGLLEAVCRFLSKRWRDDFGHHLFEDKYLAEAFKEIKDQEFETDCRKFLNLLNGRLGDKKKRVYTFPCISAFAGGKEMKKPSEESLEEFWIDFNAGSQSVTFYVDCNKGKLWDSLRLSKENVKSYSVTGKKSKTPSSGMKAKPSEKPLEEEPMDEQILKIPQFSPLPKDVTSKNQNREKSLAEKKAEGRKELYDFESSDSSSHRKVNSKQKLSA
ncbi:Synaptonemal complex protein 2-like [Lonchura striata]|uniref:Synaptonemal complex protein 2-like n=1 Tax=Lonchura striata TaxID=40157 RepID=A0A218UX77_9PASE|nr:Synaptonemal complex protein 2-like [Lonchura striata domestica]